MIGINFANVDGAQVYLYISPKRSINGSRLVFMSVLVLSMLCAACQSKRVIPPTVEWNFQPDSIHIHYDAAVDLNLYGGSPHTMMLVIIQLTDAADFMNYSRTTDGIGRLMQVHDMDRRKAVNLKNMVDLRTAFISPGKKDTLTIDRVEGAKWVGIVAGYFNVVPQQSSAVYQIPVDHTKTGLVRKKISARPGDLHINIQLGNQAMHTIGDPS